MKNKLLTFLKILVSIGLSAFLLFLVFKNVAWDDFWDRAKSVDYVWVLISILLSIIAYLARAYRWNILLNPFGYELKTSRTTLAVLIGYLANLVLPRLGEITRCVVLNRQDQVPVSIAFGTVVVDRLVDVLVLVLLIAFSFFVEYERRLYQFLSTAYVKLDIPVWVWISIPILGIIGLIVFIVLVKNRNKLNGRFSTLIHGFVSGFISLKDIKNPIGFIVSTLVIWVVYYFMSYVIVFSLSETSHLGFGAGLMLIVTGGIALSLPVQSGFGTYHGMIAGMLVLYGIEQNTGIFLATLLHTSQIIAIAFFGTIALIISFFIRRKGKRKAAVG
jgi:uncharacterized protein (TIRG00374 family)